MVELRKPPPVSFCNTPAQESPALLFSFSRAAVSIHRISPHNALGRVPVRRQPRNGTARDAGGATRGPPHGQAPAPAAAGGPWLRTRRRRARPALSPQRPRARCAPGGRARPAAPAGLRLMGGRPHPPPGAAGWRRSPRPGKGLCAQAQWGPQGTAAERARDEAMPCRLPRPAPW